MAETIRLVEQHHIWPDDPRFEAIDRAAFASKNLYNQANYLIRQAFIFEGGYLGLKELYARLKRTDSYGALPRKVSNQVLLQLGHAWQAFFKAVAAWQEDPTRFLGRPCLPGYKPKTAGRNLLVYEQGAISRRALKRGLIRLSGLNLTLATQQQAVDQVRIVAHKGHYVVEVVYSVTPEPVEGLDDKLAAGIDLGLRNLATLTSNKPGLQPVVVNGRPLKSENQYYHKKRAYLQSRLPPNRRTSHQIISLTNKRNRKVKHYLHVVSRWIIDRLVAEGIGTLVIGKNDGWKQDINLGKQTNQSFVTLPLAQLVEMLVYKARLVGIKVILHEESYTSKCSFLDLEPIGQHALYLGRRVRRGLFRAADGRLINADVNGSYNIIRKAIPDAFRHGVAGVLRHPKVVHVVQRNPKGERNRVEGAQFSHRALPVN